MEPQKEFELSELPCPCIKAYGKYFFCMNGVYQIRGEHREFCDSLYALCPIFRKSEYNEPNLVGRKRNKGTDFMR